MGAEPPWSSGRESRGDRLEIGPLWRFLSPVSFPLKETGSRRSAKSPRPVPVPAAAVTSPPLALRETASGPPPLKGRQDRLPFRGAGAKRLRGQPRLSSFVPRKPPSPVQKWGIQWGRSPLEIPRGSRGTRDGGRKTKDERRWTRDEGRERRGTGDEGRGDDGRGDEGRELGRGTGAWTKDGGLDGSYGLPHPLRGFAMTGPGAGRPLRCPAVREWNKIIYGF